MQKIAVVDEYPEDIIHDNSAFNKTITISQRWKENVAKLRARNIQVMYNNIWRKGQFRINVGRKRRLSMEWISRIEKRPNHFLSKELEKNGDYIIMHWDDDDWYAPDKVLKLIDPLRTQQATMSLFGLRNILLVGEDGVQPQW